MALILVRDAPAPECRRIQTVALTSRRAGHSVPAVMTQAPGPIRIYYRHLFRQMVQQAIVD
jgi:hypothetical protein